MNILGIETSCDETAAAVVKNGSKVLSNVIASQIDLHKKTGGVVPEVAAREHIVKIIPVIEEALQEASCTWEDIDAIAVTQGPGLITALLTGTITGSTLALIKQKPLIPAHHILAHVYSNWLERNSDEIKFPALVLTVSGGHNDLILMRDHYDFELIGESRDDAAGEAFDKVAKLLGLSYPGGPAIQKEAENADSDAILLPIANLDNTGGSKYDFSFSGLKTAVLYEVIERFGKKYSPQDIDNKIRADIAASFQKTVVNTLINKLITACEDFSPKEIHIAGGVSANSLLRKTAEEKLSKFGTPLRYPKNIRYCTDNAAMIAAAGYFKFVQNENKYKNWKNIQPDPNFTF